MKTAFIGLGIAATLVLAGCSSTGVTVNNAPMNSEQLTPVQSGSVSASALPPIGPNGEVQGPAPLTPLDPNAQPSSDLQPGVSGGLVTANADGSFTNVPAVGALPNSSGRDLTGGLSVEKLLGRWTIVSGTEQCQLNLTQTAKTGTGRYRASAPVCGLPGISVIASWTLAGSQVQLFDENGDIVAALILSGNRFVGTLAGGQGISMVG